MTNQNINNVVTDYILEKEIKKINYTIPYGIDLINAPYMWSNGYTGKKVTIAIIDTGCDTRHPDLRGKIIGGKNFTSDDNYNPRIYRDYNGHGTHVAGIIAAGNKKKRGVVGVAPDSKLLVLKALDKNGSGKYSWIIDAIDYAIERKVDIISMSLGGEDDIKELHEAIAKAVCNNILVVAAAGNEGDNLPYTNELSFPGAYKESISVGAIDKNKEPAYFTNSNKEVDVLAPGVNILSTYKNGMYAILSGTSMATPFVSGSLALLIEWSRQEFGRILDEPELYAQLVKNTVSINIERTIQGNGYVYLDPVITK